MKTPKTPPTEADKTVLRMLVRARKDFMDQRISMCNRIGEKADGTEQGIEERQFSPDDVSMIKEVATAAKEQEAAIEKKLKKILRRFPIYTDYLSGVKGVGTIAAGQIISEFDIRIATTVSKMWQYAGLNPGLVRGKKRVEKKDGAVEYKVTDKMIRGDRMTPGFVAPFNKNLRVALCGILADSFIKSQSPYALEFYYPYKHRLESSIAETTVTVKGGKQEKKRWCDVSKGHRDSAAKRYMVKMFLKDLYNVWREMEGLEVRPPYQEEYLGHKHTG